MITTNRNPDLSGPIVELRNVVKTFGAGVTEIRALDGVSLTVMPGEFVAIMGPSGCGKSTMLHLGGGLELPTAGNVLFEGRDLTTMSIAELAEVRRRRLGYVFQSLNLIPSLTALENVMFPLELDGCRSVGGPRRGQGSARTGRHRRAARPLSRFVLGWPAAADRDRPLGRRRPARRVRRRAHRCPRHPHLRPRRPHRRRHQRRDPHRGAVMPVITEDRLAGTAPVAPVS
jgi:ABC-type sugar transport system ATPase subunit